VLNGPRFHLPSAPEDFITLPREHVRRRAIELRDSLIVHTNDAYLPYSVLMATSFTARDGEIGRHNKGALVWDVSPSNGVGVRVAMDWAKNLEFTALLAHLSGVAVHYDNFKMDCGKATQRVREDVTTVVPRITNTAFKWGGRWSSRLPEAPSAIAAFFCEAPGSRSKTPGQV
jgi:hypothetical protein